MIIILGGIAHCTLGVVHRAGSHTDKRNSHVVCNLIDSVRAPFHLLQAMHSLIVHDVRPGPVQSGRLICAVEVYHQMIFGRHFSRTLVEINHNLVIPVHEVHLETFDAHL